jgi:hypothetical protein
VIRRLPKILHPFYKRPSARAEGRFFSESMAKVLQKEASHAAGLLPLDDLFPLMK